MQEATSLMSFPCDFPIKIIGKNHRDVIEHIVEILHAYFPDTLQDELRYKPSKNNKYIAVTITLHVNERSTLDALYVALKQHADINMVL